MKKERSIWVSRSIIWNKHYLDFEISWWIEKLNYKSVGEVRKNREKENEEQGQKGSEKKLWNENEIWKIP